MSILNLILAFFLPPVGAFLQVAATKHFFINIILTICCPVFYMPSGWL